MRLAVLAVLAALALSAQQPLTLRSALDRALASHALLAAREARTDVARAGLLQAGLRPNPRAVFQTENLRPGGATPFRFSEDTDNFLYLSQIFETGGKRGLRMEVARAEVRGAELNRDLTRYAITTRVASAYWAAAGGAQIRDLLRRSTENFSRIVQYHRDRVREGAAAEADLIRVQLEQDRIDIAAATAAQEAERLRIALYREMGVAPEDSTEFAESLSDLRPAPVADIDEVLRSRPDIQTARQAIDRAEANIRLQRSFRIPDAELLGGFKRTSGFNTVIGGVQINLPFSNRNQGAIAAAEAERRAAQSEARALEFAVRAEILAAQRDYEARRRQVETAIEPLRQRAEETQRIAQAAYREGGTDLLRLLDAERTRIETELLYIRTMIDYQQSVAALKAALGVMP